MPNALGMPLDTCDVSWPAMAPILPLDMPRCDSDTDLRAHCARGEKSAKMVKMCQNSHALGRRKVKKVKTPFETISPLISSKPVSFVATLEP